MGVGGRGDVGDSDNVSGGLVVGSKAVLLAVVPVVGDKENTYCVCCFILTLRFGYSKRR